MDATNDRSRGRRGRRHRRRRRSQAATPPDRTISLPTRLCEFVENKMGLPPPYEQTSPNPAPPPSYFGNNPPPAAGFVVPEAAPRTTVITTTSTGDGATAPVKLGPGRTGTTCTHCNRSVVTYVDYVPNNRTHIVSAALCVLAGCCCACLFPYCMKSCKTANHYCPKCRSFLGTYTPS